MMTKYLHKMSKEKLISYIEKIQECQLTFYEIDYISNLLLKSDKEILNKLEKQKEMLRK